MRTAKRASTAIAPTKPSSSPMMAKMKSVCASGKIEELLSGLADPTSQGPSAADGQIGLDDLEAAASRVLPRVEKGHDPAQAIRGDHDEHHHHREGGHQDESQSCQRSAGQEEQPERQGQQGEAIAEVGLQQHEPGQRRRHQQRGQQPAPELASCSRASRQECSQVDDQGQLGQLDGLKGHRAEPEPAPGPVDRLAEGRNEHEDQQDDGHDERRHHQLLQAPIVDLQGHPQGAARPARPRRAAS